MAVNSKEKFVNVLSSNRRVTRTSLGLEAMSDVQATHLALDPLLLGSGRQLGTATLCATRALTRALGRLVTPAGDVIHLDELRQRLLL
jgi:hypothetical protein